MKKKEKINCMTRVCECVILLRKGLSPLLSGRLGYAISNDLIILHVGSLVLVVVKCIRSA